MHVKKGLIVWVMETKERILALCYSTINNTKKRESEQILLSRKFQKFLVGILINGIRVGKTCDMTSDK